MSTRHSQQLRPPMPALQIRLQAEETDQMTDWLMAFVDTGADATIVPWQYLTAIGARETSPGWLRGITGERVPVALYFANIRLDTAITISGVRVVASRSEEHILLGRDVLNKLPVFLDGPRQQTEILDEQSANRLRTRRAESDQ